MDSSRAKGDRFLVLGGLAVAFGLGTGILSMANWFSFQTFLSSYSSGTTDSLVLRFFLGDLLATVLVVLGLYQVYRVASSVHDIGGENMSLRSIISGALSSGRDKKIGVVSALLYGAIYSFTSGFVVYQPSVDFAQAYGITTPGWATISCCGALGTVPRIILYFPSIHTGVQVIPLNSLFLATIPLLVGFNLAVVSFAMRNGMANGTGRWMSAFGASIALFTACPTCAGLFLATAIGGLGATTLAVALAPYQLAFVLVSLPVLLLSPLLTLTTFRRFLKAGCAVPRPRGMGETPN